LTNTGLNKTGKHNETSKPPCTINFTFGPNCGKAPEMATLRYWRLPCGGSF